MKESHFILDIISDIGIPNIGMIYYQLHPYHNVTLNNITDEMLIQCIHKTKYKFTSNYYTKMFSGAWNYALSDRNMIRAQRDFNFIHVNAKQNVKKMHYDTANLYWTNLIFC